MGIQTLLNEIEQVYGQTFLLIRKTLFARHTREHTHGTLPKALDTQWQALQDGDQNAVAPRESPPVYACRKIHQQRRDKKRSVACLAVATSIVLSSASVGIQAACRDEIMRYNIAGTALLTMATAYFKGNLSNAQDVFNTAFYGGLSGYGFYKAKEYIGDSRVQKGIATAYFSSSVAENVTNNENPIGYLRYGLGPAEIRARTPFAKTSGDWLSLDFEAIEIPRALITMIEGEDLSVRDGIITGTTRRNCDEISGHARGRYILICEEALDDDLVFQHEAVHVVQAIQLQSFGYRFDTGQNIGLRAGIGELAMVVPQLVQDYEDRWYEIEAERMGADRDIANPSYDKCNGAVGVQFSLEF